MWCNSPQNFVKRLKLFIGTVSCLYICKKDAVQTLKDKVRGLGSVFSRDFHLFWALLVYTHALNVYVEILNISCWGLG